MGWDEEIFESMELTKTDVEVSIDKDVGWADRAVSLATCVQPGDGRYQTVRPSDHDLTPLLLGKPFKRSRLVSEEAVESAFCICTSEEDAHAVFFEI